jgi:predicted heme/steroid binding protein
MSNPNRRAGIIYVKVDGQIYDAKGNFTYNLGRPKREGIAGADTVHGFKETPQVPFIEGEFTDKNDLDLNKLLTIEDSTITLELNNGKTVVLKNAWYAADGDVGTEEGNIQVRFEGKQADEI